MRYENCYKCSLTRKDSVDKLFLIFSEFYKNQSFYDLTFLMISSSWCFWWVVRRDYLFYTLMSLFWFYLFNVYAIFMLMLTFIWWIFICFFFFQKCRRLFLSILAFLLYYRLKWNQNSFSIDNCNLSWTKII